MVVFNDAKSARYWAFISLIVTMLLCIPATVFLALSPYFIPYYLTGLNTAVVVKAQQHVLFLIPAFWFHSIYRIIQNYIQSQISARAQNLIRDSSGEGETWNSHVQSFYRYLRFLAHHLQLLFGGALGLACNILGIQILFHILGGCTHDNSYLMIKRRKFSSNVPFWSWVHGLWHRDKYCAIYYAYIYYSSFMAAQRF